MKKPKRNVLTARKKRIVSEAFDIGYKLGRGCFMDYEIKFTNIEGYYDFNIIREACAKAALEIKEKEV